MSVALRAVLHHTLSPCNSLQYSDLADRWGKRASKRGTFAEISARCEAERAVAEQAHSFGWRTLPTKEWCATAKVRLY
jgi:hypothetical protein